MSFTSIILLAAKKAGVSGALLLAICTHESGLRNVLVPHDGGSPSYGICQVKYDTAKMIGFSGKEKDLMDPTINAKWAAEYLKFQKERYDGDWMKSTAAYNSGTYNESRKIPGCPRNLTYLKYVQKKLDENLQHKLECGKEVEMRLGRLECGITRYHTQLGLMDFFGIEYCKGHCGCHILSISIFYFTWMGNECYFNPPENEEK